MSRKNLNRIYYTISKNYNIFVISNNPNHCHPHIFPQVILVTIYTHKIELDEVLVCLKVLYISDSDPVIAYITYRLAILHVKNK